ncbi:membrane-spanning 4-domains subfamily A member 15-like [Ahaetulla prasina]|uniref:membrane-spanning 4-domains subfamily A member 15-like n=1 Tax=Ahaetulla prasina TaxID=499056 RepID=UPI0026476B7A|nr:membrane-spanning 4-domains subfamily A member 15-like [Ahaetulla prasina]
MASGNIVVMPSKGANIQTASGLSNVGLQASEAIPYPQPGAQQLGASTSAPQQVPQKSPLQDFLNAETKVLGAVQIMIGLLHIGFGTVVISLPSSNAGVTTIAGYPFWGGVFFISSGSLCITAVNNRNRALVKSSVGMNITSAIMALIGILICIADLAVTSSGDQSLSQTYKIKNAIDSGLSGMLLLFSLLEFCITVSFAHFGCQTNCCTDNQPTLVFVPYQVNRDATVACERNQRFPPAYDNVITQP